MNIQKEIEKKEREIEQLKLKLPKDKIKIFEALTIKEALKSLLKEGYFPATLKQVYDLRELRKIREIGYDTSTLYLEGEIQTITKEQLKNIEKIYQRGGRLLFLSSDYNGLNGDSNLDNKGRFVGVASKDTKEAEK